MKRKPYDYESAAKLGNYVRKRYRNQLSNGALSFYLCALPYLERSGLGLCQPITATYPKLAEAGFRNKSHLREVLDSLTGVLLEVEPGTPIKGAEGKKATRLRRYSLPELMHGEPSRRLIDYTPADAKTLADLLYSRTFVYGTTPACRPCWNVSRTGRVLSKQPNVQNDAANKRAKCLCVGLQPGEVLIHADYKSAEPTIIQKVVGYSFQADPYQTAADLLGIDRGSAKRKINQLAYMWDSRVALTFWKNPEAEAAFTDYAEALTDYKEKLWTAGRPHGKQRRFTNTLSGRKIQADRGDPPHRGRVLSWQIQGTVADLLNAATLKAINREQSEGWRVFFPEHDALYVAGTPEQADTLRRFMKAEANRLKLPLEVKVETCSTEDVVRK